MSIHILATYCLHVFADGVLEHSAFPGGYFDRDGSVRYYITDWQCLNVYDFLARTYVPDEARFFNHDTLDDLDDLYVPGIFC